MKVLQMRTWEGSGLRRHSAGRDSTLQRHSNCQRGPVEGMHDLNILDKIIFRRLDLGIADIQRSTQLAKEAAWRATPGCSATERSDTATSSNGESSKHLIVRSLPPVRKAAPPPEPVPVQHSPSYLLRNCNRPVSFDIHC